MGVTERFVELVNKSGLKQKVIASRIDVTETWVSNRYRGVTRIMADEVPLLAKALNVPCMAFFVGSVCPDEARSSRPRPRILETVEREMMKSLDELPEPERDFVEGVGRLLVEYRGRLLAEERREAEG